MFRPLSPLDMVQRVDVTVDAGVLASGYIGSWVTIYYDAEGSKWPTTSQKARFATSSYNPVYVIWTEGMKRGATVGSYPARGFSPDALNTSKVTTLVGKWRALTDLVSTSATKTPGTLLCPDPTSTTGALMELPKVNISGAMVGNGTFYVYSGMACAVVRNYYTWLDHMGVTYSGVWEIESLI